MAPDQFDWTEIQAAYDKVPYPQMPLLSESQLKSALTNRGMRLFPNGLQHLMDSGIIGPLKENPPEFHPFQIWLISKLFSTISINLTGQFSYSGFNLELLYKNLLRQWERLVQDVQGFGHSKAVTEFLRILPLLFWVESYYFPQVKAARPGIVSFVGSDSDDWIDWRKKQDIRTWLAETGLSIDEVKKWHNNILWEAHNLDPASNWYLLMRSAEYSKREKLQGPLRLAYDFYEIAELLRLYIADVSGEQVSKEWDPTGHTDTYWAKRLYKVDEIKVGSRDLLRPLIREYGLDPSFRVIWLVEGDTEEAFIKTYCDDLGIISAESYITFRNFKGDTNFQMRLDVLNQELRTAAIEQCFVTLTFDDTPGTRDRIKELQTNDLITVTYALNKPDFERQNFSTSELVDVVYSWADECGVSIPIVSEEFTKEVEAQLSKTPTSLKSVVNKTLFEHSVPFNINKGKEWGERLAKYLGDKRETQFSAGEYSEEVITKVERQILRVLRASEPNINYPLSIEHMNVDLIELL